MTTTEMMDDDANDDKGSTHEVKYGLGVSLNSNPHSSIY